MTALTSSRSFLANAPASETLSSAFLISLTLVCFVKAFLGAMEGAFVDEGVLRLAGERDVSLREEPGLGVWPDGIMRSC